MILADDVLLLLTDDETGASREVGVRLECVLAGALLAELLLLGRVRVTGPGESVRPGRVVVADREAVGDPVLDEALGRIASGTPKTPQSLITQLRPGVVEALRARRAEDEEHEVALRAALREVLADGREPSPREAGVVAVLHAVNRVPAAVRELDLPVGVIRARAGAIAHLHVGADAVRGAIRAADAAAPRS